MDEFPGGIARAWSFPPALFTVLLLTTVIYLRGWRLVRRTRPNQIQPSRAACFIAGICSLWVAFASPIEALDDYLLAAHMIQHFILMSIAPPLLLLGAPVVPLFRGMPHSVVRGPLRVLFQSRLFRSIRHVVVQPVFAWMAMNLFYLGWHIPAAFELALRSEGWHTFEHACFLLTSIFFWWVVIAPWPHKSHWPRWTIIPYLLGADLVNTILSAVLSFCGRVLYPSYSQAERVSRLTPLQDQVAAGSEMWVLNSLVFLVPAIVLTLRLLSPLSLREGHTPSG